MAVRVTRAGVGLTIGIIVLAGLVLGGIFLVRQRGEVARNDATMKIAEQKLKDESNQGVALNQGNGDQGNNQGSSNSNGSNTSSGSSNTSTAELPQTGPAEDSLFSFVVIALLVFVSVSYWRSRRGLLQA